MTREKSIWGRWGAGVEYEVERLLKECLKERSRLISTLSEADYMGGMAKLFPRLQNVAVSAIYGEEMYWIEATTHQGESKKGFQHEPYRQCLYLFNTFLTSGSLQHFCVRDLHGALSMLPVELDIHNPKSRYSRTVHITAEPAHIPLPFGYPTRRVSDTKPQDDWSGVIKLIYRELSLKFKLFQKRREEQPEEEEPVMLSIYSSSSHCSKSGFKENIQNPWPSHVPQISYTSKWSVDQQRHITDTIGNEMQSKCREVSGLKDTIKWYAVADTPPCPACGHRPESG